MTFRAMSQSTSSDVDDIDALRPSTQLTRCGESRENGQKSSSDVVVVISPDVNSRGEKRALDVQRDATNERTNARAASSEVIDLLDDEDEDGDETRAETANAASAEPSIAAKTVDRDISRENLGRDGHGATTMTATTSEKSAEKFPPMDCAKREFSQITCVLDVGSFFAADTTGYGRALQIAFDATRQKSPDKVIMYAYEPLPLPRSVTWRYHVVSDRAVGGDSWNAEMLRSHRTHSARYTAVLLSGERFLEIIENDCEKLKEMVATFERHSECTDDKLCLIVEAPHKNATNKERRNCDYDNPSAGWSREHYDAVVAQMAVQYSNVVLVALPGMNDCVEHVVLLHNQLAVRRSHQGLSMKDFLTDKSGEYMDGQKKKPKHETTQRDFFMRALTKISGVTAPHARGIVHEFESMVALMAAYDDPSTTLEFKKNMLAHIIPYAMVQSSGVAVPGGGKKQFGPAKSARVYEFFKPRAADDMGDDILTRLSDV